MEKEILEVLQNINTNLNHLVNRFCKPVEDMKCEDKEDDEEKEIMDFLKDLTESLGLKDQVVIRKVTIK